MSERGAATYEVPIAVPPGTAGMIPSLSLEYSSQGGNGLVGVGWVLNGLPSIGRCPQTMAQDGARGSVGYNLSDRFCMAGQRLMLVSGTYGTAGSEYRTEIEGFSKITANGTAGNGPAWFQVKTKTGQVMEFGNTTDSRVLAQGKTTARSWAVNKISDVKGNYLTITYTNDTTNGQVYPIRIDYTGNAAAGLTPYNSVQFVYETRPDIEPLYMAGSMQKSTVRLMNIRTYEGANVVTDYRLAYGVSPSTYRSRLTSVTLCSGTGVNDPCMPETVFAYGGTVFVSGSTDGITTIANPSSTDGTFTNGLPILADVDGDGKTDVIWNDVDTYARGLASGNVGVWLSNWEGGTGSFSVVTPTPSGLNDNIRFSADVNARGLSDIIWFESDQKGHADGNPAPVVLWNATSTGDFSVSSALSPSGIDNNFYPISGDFNGDGRQDILWQRDAKSCNTSSEQLDARILWMSLGGDTYSVTTNVNGADAYMGDCSYGDGLSSHRGTFRVLGTGDFNGDGKTDIYWEADSGDRAYVYRRLWLSNGDGTFAVIMNVGGKDNDYTNYKKVRVVDFNGDGVSDIFFEDNTYERRSAWMGHGDGTFDIVENLNGANGDIGSYFPFFGDFDGDGRADIYWANESSGQKKRRLWLSRGYAAFQEITNFGGRDGTGFGDVSALSDLNGDGKTDILYDNQDDYGRSNGTRKLWLSDGVAPDLLTSVTSGLGSVTSVTYAPLTDDAVYTKGTGSSYPLIDVQAPIYVVSGVDADDGIGGTYTSAYTYESVRADLNGRGFLGVARQVITDPQTGVVQETNFRQDYPYIGFVSSRTKTLGGLVLNETQTSYTATSLGGTRYMVVPSQTVEMSRDLDGSVIPAVTTDYQYDAYGNVTQMTVSTPDGASKTTVNTYTNDTANWYLGRLTGSTVTSTVP